MVSTRRQVINEQDRYGGFEASSKSRVYSDNSETGTGELYSGFSGERTQNESAQGFNYTVVDTPRIEPVRRAKSTVEVPAPTVKTRPVKRSREDLMPKIDTRRVKNEESYKEASETVAKSEKLDKAAATARTKVILAVYVAVVVFLAAIVIITGVAVTNSGAAVSRLETEYAAKNDFALSLHQELEHLSDDNFIKNEGFGMGMGEITNPIIIEQSEGITPVVYKSRTNPFDKFCDWLSGLLN